MEKRRQRIPMKQTPEFTGKPAETEDPQKDNSENSTEEIPQPGELTQENEDPGAGNIGKNNAGGFE